MQPEPVGPKFVYAELFRVLASDCFDGQKREKQILRYIGGAFLSNNRVSESLIALEVFEMRDFDPARTATIRSWMTKLRSRLRAYYRAEGKEDHVRLDIPDGSYELAAFWSPNPSKKTVAVPHPLNFPPIDPADAAEFHARFIWPGYEMLFGLTYSLGAFGATVLDGTLSLPDAICSFFHVVKARRFFVSCDIGVGYVFDSAAWLYFKCLSHAAATRTVLDPSFSECERNGSYVILPDSCNRLPLPDLVQSRIHILPPRNPCFYAVKCNFTELGYIQFAIITTDDVPSEYHHLVEP
jgi:hypothetical protein